MPMPKKRLGRQDLIAIFFEEEKCKCQNGKRGRQIEEKIKLLLTYFSDAKLFTDYLSVGLHKVNNFFPLQHLGLVLQLRLVNFLCLYVTDFS